MGTRCKQNFSICWFVGWIQLWDCSKRWYFMTTHSEDSQKETKGDSKRAPEKIKKYVGMSTWSLIFLLNDFVEWFLRNSSDLFGVLAFPDNEMKHIVWPLCRNLGMIDNCSTLWLFQNIMWVRSKMSSILTSFYAASTPVDFLFIGGPKSKAIPGTNRLPHQSNFLGILALEN